MTLQHDLLAELELTMVPSARRRPAPGLYLTAEERAGAGPASGSSRRTFWCARKEQEVEVEFETRRFLGFPRLVALKRCSAFCEPEAVACGRHCLDAKYRRQWPFALPVARNRRASEG